MATSVSGIGSISSTGIGSGLNVTDILDRLMAVEQRPLDLLRTAGTGLSTRLSNVGKLQGFFSAMRDKANVLTAPTLWTGTTATSADTSAVKVSTRQQRGGRQLCGGGQPTGHRPDRVEHRPAGIHQHPG